MKIAQALCLLRNFHQLKQKQLATQLKISNSHLSEVESGKKKVTLELLLKYSELFKIEASSIVFLAENIDGGDTTNKSVHPKISAIINFINLKNEQENSEERDIC